MSWFNPISVKNLLKEAVQQIQSPAWNLILWTTFGEVHARNIQGNFRQIWPSGVGVMLMDRLTDRCTKACEATDNDIAKAHISCSGELSNNSIISQTLFSISLLS